MPDWVLNIWNLIVANPYLTAGIGLVLAIIANKAGYVLPEKWREYIYNACVAALGKLLGFQPKPSVPVAKVVSAQQKLAAFEVLTDGCCDCPGAHKPLQDLWAHLQPGHDDVSPPTPGKP